MKLNNHKPWPVLTILLSFVFLVPAFLLLRPAAKPSARAAHAANHGFIQLDNEEGALLFQAMQIRQGDISQVYHSLKKPPYVAGTYPPLFMATVAAIDDFQTPGFATGRAVVWFAALGVAILLVLLITATTRNAPLGMLAGFLFLATWEVYRWIGYFRVDFPAIFLSLAGLSVVVLARGKTVALVFGALLMTLALYTKQTTIAAPAACFAALLLKQPRQAMLLVLLMFAWGLPPLIALSILTDGEFLRHIILYNINIWHEFNLQVWSRHVWHMHRWFFITGLAALPWLLWQMGKDLVATRQRSPEPNPIDTGITPAGLFGFWQPIAWYALFAQWNFFAIAKAGSAENYLLEPLAGWAILVCMTAGGMIRQTSSLTGKWRRASSALLCMAILAGLTTHAIVVSRPKAQQIRFSPFSNPGRPDFQAAQIIRTIMDEAENPYSELAVYHLQTDTPPVIQPFIMSELARQGRWDPKKFVRDIRSAKFDVVIALEDLTSPTSTDVYTREMLHAFHHSYKVDRILRTPLWNYHILVPKDDSDQPGANEIVYLAK